MTFVDFNRYFCIFILRILYTLSHHFRIIPLSHFILFTFALSSFHTFAFYNFPGAGCQGVKIMRGKVQGVTLQFTHTHKHLRRVWPEKQLRWLIRSMTGLT